MAIQLKEKGIRETFTTFGIGYCQCETLLGYLGTRFYTAGVYGWKSDIYFLQSPKGSRVIVISSGYSPVGTRLDRKTCEIMEKYADKLNGSKYPYSRRLTMIQKYIWETLEKRGYIK